MPTISVILPIYNAEPFLEECLDSIKNQTFADIEVLCVNDGSTDSSIKTIQKFCDTDDRFILLDKPNGGYGHSLNYGLKHAKGQYVSIIEPDDFIDSKMYEDLLLFAKANNHEADIIKGSYWEYFDAQDDFGEVLRKPNLLREMKQTPFSFILEDDAEIFTHHPSIWSALYKKEFLDFNSIRFVEPKGAGWADNPFFVETLLKAKKIIWVPNGYYYYRQTNPSASSFLKDYRIPFDRLREMRAILYRSHANEEIWGAFYRREFDYIHSIINEFGFQEKNPDIYSLIYEALNDIDEKILLASRFIQSKDIKYYNRFLEEYQRNAQKNDAMVSLDDIKDSFMPVDISFILPVKDHAQWLSDCVESIQECGIQGKEIVCIECGSSDRSSTTCSHLARVHSNVISVDAGFNSFADGINAIVPLLKSKYFFIFDPSRAVKGDLLQQAFCHLLDSNPDIAVFDSKKRFLANIMCLSGKVLADEKDGDLICDAKTDNISPFLLNLFSIAEPAIIYKTALIKDLDLKVEPGDCIGAPSLGCKALISAHTVSYIAGTCQKVIETKPNLVPFLPDLHDELVREKAPMMPALSELLNSASFADKRFAQSKANFLVSVFMNDISTRCFPETIYAYVDTYLKDVSRFCAQIKGRAFFDIEQYYDFQLIEKKGIQAYLATQYLYKSNDVKSLRQNLESVFSSARFTVGSKIARLYQKTSVGPLRYIIDKRMR
ncbi:MAG: glycosyltransferase [Eggerthellaceae bacterium]